MQLHGWYDKACKLLSSTWRVYGAPDSEEVASEGFLTNLASEVGASKDALPGPSAVPPPVGIVTVDEEGFDCRIGKRARKRRREARKIVEPKQKTVNIKAGGKPILLGYSNVFPTKVLARGACGALFEIAVVTCRMTFFPLSSLSTLA